MTLDAGLTAFRVRLAAALADADGRPDVYGYPCTPPSFTAPCYIVQPESGYALGRATACIVPVAVTVRCIPIAVDQPAVYDELDAMIETVYAAPGAVVVSAMVGARDVAGQTMLVADVDVSANVTLATLTHRS
jgi:hypothetical protein